VHGLSIRDRGDGVLLAAPRVSYALGRPIGGKRDESPCRNHGGDSGDGRWIRCSSGCCRFSGHSDITHVDGITHDDQEGHAEQEGDDQEGDDQEGDGAEEGQGRHGGQGSTGTPAVPITLVAAGAGVAGAASWRLARR